MAYIYFGDCMLDTQRRELHRPGASFQLRKRQKVFGVLFYLLTHRDRVVSRQELFERVWRRSLAQQAEKNNATLDSTLVEVRKCLGETGRTPQYIEALRSQGYYFRATVSVQRDDNRGDATLRAIESADLREQEIMDDSQQMSLSASRRGLRNERRQVTVLGLNIFKPVESATVATLRERIEEVVKRFDGTTQYRLLSGDGVWALFGVPTALEGHAFYAVHAALAIQEEILRGNPAQHEPAEGIARRLGIVIHTGSVLMDPINDEPTSEGEVMRQAQALLLHAQPGEILLSEALYHLVHEEVQGEIQEPLAQRQALSGVLYRVMGQRWRDTALETRTKRYQHTPFVGRQSELAMLHMLLARVETGRGQVIGIVGEPSIGKSRLLYEFQQSLKQERVCWLTGNSPPYGRVVRYRPFLDMLRTACQVKEGDTEPQRQRKLQQAIHLLPSQLGQKFCPYLEALFDVADAKAKLQYQAPHYKQQKTIEALEAFALALSESHPLVLVAENLHWVDPASEECLARLIESVPGHRLLVITTFRPEYKPRWWTHSAHYSQIALDVLPISEAEALARKFLGHQKTLPPDLPHRIGEQAGGNPLFIEQLCRSLRERIQLSRRTQGSPVAGYATIELPKNIQTSICERTHRLREPVQRVLQLATVIGHVFRVDLLRKLADPYVVQEALKTLQQMDFMHETAFWPKRIYQFKHILMWDAVYHAIEPAIRRQYHRDIAEILDKRFPDVKQDQPEQLAHHYTEAGLYAQAVRYWLQAGQHAAWRSAHQEAIHHLETGLHLLTEQLPETPERMQQELTIQMVLGPVLTATKGLAALDVERVLTRANELGKQMGDTQQRFPALWGLFRWFNTQGKFLRARELGEDLLNLAQEQRNDPTLLLAARAALGTTLYFLGEFSAAHSHLKKATTLANPEEQGGLAIRYGVAPIEQALAYEASTLWCLGYPDQAHQKRREALDFARRLGRPYSLAQALYFDARHHMICRNVQAAQEQAEAAGPLATEQGFQLWAVLSVFVRGWALATQGQIESGLAQMHQGLAAAQATGTMVVQPLFRALLAEVYGNMGKVDEAQRELKEAMAVSEDGQHFYAAETYRLQGVLLLHQAVADAGHAEACFQQALTIARRQQAKSWELRAATSLARLWQQQGKRAEAHTLLAPIYDWFTEGFDTVDLQEAKALLNTFKA
jgi:predicted ATPase/DNA-binding winged helix-turn-helix (wHTH) protein